MTARQCLNHPWLRVSVTPTPPPIPGLSEGKLFEVRYRLSIGLQFAGVLPSIATNPYPIQLTQIVCIIFGIENVLNWIQLILMQS